MCIGRFIYKFHGYLTLILEVKSQCCHLSYLWKSNKNFVASCLILSIERNRSDGKNNLLNKTHCGELIFDLRVESLL